MFILVQDKSRLVKVNDILVQDYKIVGVKHDSQIILGSYENNNAAMEVMVKITDSFRRHYMKLQVEPVFVMPNR